MEEMKHLGIGLSVGALMCVGFLLQLIAHGEVRNVEALMQSNVSVSALQEPKQLTAAEYVNTMMTWPSRPKKANSIIATVE